MPIGHPDHAIKFEPPASTTRYLLTGGYVIDCRSGVPGSSSERDYVLERATKLFGKDPDRCIVGESTLAEEPALDIGIPTTGKKR